MKTVKELAQYYRVTPRTFRKWVKDKKIPSHKIGRKYLFDPKVVATYLTSGKSFDMVIIDDPALEVEDAQL